MNFCMVLLGLFTVIPFAHGELPPAVAAKQKVVSCHVVGGLGNQLFQIANALAVAWDYGYEPIFPRILQSDSYLYPRPVYWDSMFHKIPTYDPREVSESDLHLTPYFEESSFYYKKINPENDRIKFSGYFISAKYFDHHREKIWEVFKLPAELEAENKLRYLEIVASGNEETVSIHIRLDDTFIAPIPGVIDFWKEPYASYYDQAIALFPGDVTFVIFSDNCAWSREYMKEKLRGRRAVYICGKDYLDVHLMALCKHNIIVNSTYSWWGAYLNRNPNKIVVSPKYWQAKGNTPYRPDILMPNWTLIENEY